MTGPELIELVEAFLAKHPEVSRTRFARAARGRNGMNDLKDVKTVKPVTIAKIRAMMENPSDYLFVEPCSASSHDFDRADRINAKRAATIRRNLAKRAAAYLDGDKSVLSAGGGVRQDIAAAARMISEQRESQRRYTDPLERAKLLLQRRFRPVCSAEIVGGPAGKFLVGRKIVSKRELMAMARKAAA